MEAIRWIGNEDGHLVLIDQTRLPLESYEVACHDVETVWEAIRMLRVRGAPAIGIAAAYGLCVALKHSDCAVPSVLRERFDESLAYLASSRPTAVNLFWALERMRRVFDGLGSQTGRETRRSLWQEARRIHEEDRKTCHAIGSAGAPLIADGTRVLTHCNTGGLATSEYGTALSVVFTAHDQGKRVHVFVDETRPLLQGARLTAWELVERGIPATLICDSMAAQVMREGRVDVVITGADRIAANGDAANKIGTYSLAVLAHAHGIPFYIAAPRNTFDRNLPDGDAIPIEQRPAEEVTHAFGRQTAPTGIEVYNPAFDITPARLIRGIVTERGIIQPVTHERILSVLDEA